MHILTLIEKNRHPNKGTSGAVTENIRVITNIVSENAYWYPRSKYQSSYRSSEYLLNAFFIFT